jgi:hypothetical protein
MPQSIRDFHIHSKAATVREKRWLAASMGCLALFCLSSYGVAAPETAVQIGQQMQSAYEQQQKQLCSYSVQRQYTLANKHIHPSAQMKVEVQFNRGAPKKFRILETQATGIARRSLNDLLKEESASDGLDNGKNAVAPMNYDLTVIGNERCGEADCYKVLMKPKKKSKYLIEGIGWVSKTDLKFVRIEGVMSKSPSFWLSKPKIEQGFERVEGFSLPSYNRSSMNVLFLGEADLTIDYSAYTVTRCRK